MYHSTENAAQSWLHASRCKQSDRFPWNLPKQAISAIVTFPEFLGDFYREGLGRSHAGATNQTEFREICSCNIHSDCIGFSRKAALAAYWGRGVDLVLFLGESAKTKLILKRYVRGIIYNLYKMTNGSFSSIAFNSVAALSLTVCADRSVFRETCRFEWRFLPSRLLYCGEGSQITLHWIKERETWAKYWQVKILKRSLFLANMNNVFQLGFFASSFFFQFYMYILCIWQNDNRAIKQ